MTKTTPSISVYKIQGVTDKTKLSFSSSSAQTKIFNNSISIQND